MFTYARVRDNQTPRVSKGIDSRELVALAGTILAHSIRESRNALEQTETLINLEETI